MPVAEKKQVLGQSIGLIYDHRTIKSGNTVAIGFIENGILLFLIKILTSCTKSYKISHVLNDIKIFAGVVYW
jgi:hypothetical protein